MLRALALIRDVADFLRLLWQAQKWACADRDWRIKFIQDDCENMTEAQWGDWLNRLTVPEFIAMMSCGKPEETN